MLSSAAFLMRFSFSLCDQRYDTLDSYIWYEIHMQDDHDRTFLETNLRLLSFSPALDGKDKPSNTTTGITPAFFTEIKHFRKISLDLGNYKMRNFQYQK